MKPKNTKLLIKLHSLINSATKPRFLKIGLIKIIIR
jgi:hypothetical protein